MFIRSLIFLICQLVSTNAIAQLISVPVELPMPSQVDPVNFGVGLAIGGGSIFVGGLGEVESAPLTPCGVYQYNIDTMSYVKKFEGDQENIEDDFFGFAVEFENDLLWVGAP
ncbi:MAG: hypothetical protein AB8C13_09025 [Phycisphaerales bacterium]